MRRFFTFTALLCLSFIMGISAAMAQTTIKSSAEMTTTTSVPKTWDFTNTSSDEWTSSVSKLSNTTEWTKGNSTDEWRPTTTCVNREYNLGIIDGLVFNTNQAGDLCLDYTNRLVSMARGSSITIPGLKAGNYVRFTGNIEAIATPSNATLYKSGNGVYIYEVTDDGDTKFTFPSTMNAWGVWISAITVTSDVPTFKTTILVSDLDIDNNKAANQGIARQVAGFDIDFDGGQGLKAYNNGTSNDGTNFLLRNYISNNNSSKGSITISAINKDVRIRSLKFNIDNKNGETPSSKNLSFGISTGSYTNFNANYAQISAYNSEGWNDITLSYIEDSTKTTKGVRIKSFEIETDMPVSSEPITPVLTIENKKIKKGDSVSDIFSDNISPVDYTGWLYSGRITFTSSNSDVATCKGDTITGVNDGTATITATYTPTNSAYLHPASTTFTVRVIDHAVTSASWIFNSTINGSEGKGIANGQALSSDYWTTDASNPNVYTLKNAIHNEPQPITTDGTTPVFRTEGLTFTCELAGHLSIIPDDCLQMDNNGVITIENVKPTDKNDTTYVLIEAEPIEQGSRAGFIVDNDWNDQFAYSDLTSSASRQVFMLQVRKVSGDVCDVTFQPSAGMKIYRIEVTQKNTPSITATVTNAGSDTKNYTVNNGDSFSVTFNIKNADAKGELYAYSLNKVASGTPVSSDNGSVTINAKADNGGDAVIVARFTPSSDESTYTYGYATVYVNVADKTMYRVNKGGTSKVDEWITSVEGIKMQLGGWEGAADAPKEYRNGGKEDSWGRARKEAYIDTYPGYDYTFSAAENAADETTWQYTNKNIADYDQTSYWYNGAPNNPYSMPVFGGFLKFVPSENGKLEVFIHQNGVICNVKHDDGSETFNPYMMHMRSYYIGDETGKLYTGNTSDPEDGVTAETLVSAAPIWNGPDGICKRFGTLTNDTRSSFDPDDDTDYSIENNRYKADYEFFKSQLGETASTGVQTVYSKDGGWVMLNEGASRYTIPHVKAGKTYFVFTNRTKLGFYGFRFTPDNDEQEVTITPSAEGAESYKMTKSPATVDAGKSVVYKVDPKFDRELNAGMWNTLCLPFSMNEDQTKTAFPEGYEILDLQAIDNDTIKFKKHYYQMIVAGRPYLVFIPGTVGQTVRMKVPTDYVSAGDQALKAPIDVLDATATYKWVGTYSKMNPLPQNAYFVAKNPDEKGRTVIKQNISGKSWTNGYRAYLVAANGETPAKALSLDYDGVDETVVTGIDNIIAEITDPQTAGRVYNLNGQLVSQKGLQSLPKGIYIMNGRKYVVK